MGLQRVHHDAFFKYQTKPKLTTHGDLYCKGKEFEVKALTYLNVLFKQVFREELVQIVPKWSEDVCRLALQRRYRFIPHIYTLFYMAHTRGTPVVAPTFFADSKDPRLRFV
ncbi:hypothetical protein Taro_054525 [Colocasia esculenta]|uniref:DUF382 domain-containing protein n=1 Tax=Colocasia esculenta TaxID=4460 RepID=A0A843XRE6_COLES|nr:hypothetical protein [Colocasia esculenta]